jgi:hypothetical protein
MQVFTHQTFLECYTWDPAAAPGRIEAILEEIRDEIRLLHSQGKYPEQILEELFNGRPIAEEHLRELIGHTPFEVMIGAFDDQQVKNRHEVSCIVNQCAVRVG